MRLTPTKYSCNLSNPLIGDFCKMLEGGLFSDLSICTKDNQIVKAHKNILAARSPMFLKILRTDMKNFKVKSVVNVPFDLKVIKELLSFIYCSKIQNLEANANCLIFAAERYQLDELKYICMMHIIRKLTPENLLDSFMISHQVSGCDELLTRCIEQCKM